MSNREKIFSIRERHFTEDMKIRHVSGKTTLRPGSLPPLAIPHKSFPPAVTVPRQSTASITEKILLHLVHTTVLLKNLRRKFLT